MGTGGGHVCMQLPCLLREGRIAAFSPPALSTQLKPDPSTCTLHTMPPVCVAAEAGGGSTRLWRRQHSVKQAHQILSWPCAGILLMHQLGQWELGSGSGHFIVPSLM